MLRLFMNWISADPPHGASAVPRQLPALDEVELGCESALPVLQFERWEPVPDLEAPATH